MNGFLLDSRRLPTRATWWQFPRGEGGQSSFHFLFIESRFPNLRPPWTSLSPDAVQDTVSLPQTQPSGNPHVPGAGHASLPCLSHAVFPKKHFSRMFHLSTSKRSIGNWCRQHSGHACGCMVRRGWLERADRILFWSASVPQTMCF